MEFSTKIIIINIMLIIILTHSLYLINLYLSYYISYNNKLCLNIYTTYFKWICSHEQKSIECHLYIQCFKFTQTLGITKLYRLSNFTITSTWSIIGNISYGFLCYFHINSYSSIAIICEISTTKTGHFLLPLLPLQG